VSLSLNDLESSWAGLRPLIHEEGKSASELSRKDEIFESPSGLISIAGGKLTGYRKMAERVVNLVIKKHFSEKLLSECRTHQLKLTSNPFNEITEVRKFKQSLAKKLENHQLPAHIPDYLIENYGQQVVLILDQWTDRNPQEDPELSLLKSELSFCLRYEMVCTLQDFFVRRTGLVHFDIQKVVKWKKEILEVFKDFLKWDDTRVAREMDALDRLLHSLTHFKA
jgi:glycerol-3-phosphate dehydrogenase